MLNEIFTPDPEQTEVERLIEQRRAVKERNDRIARLTEAARQQWTERVYRLTGVPPKLAAKRSADREYLIELWDRMTFAFGGECQECGVKDLRLLMWCHVAPTPILGTDRSKGGFSRAARDIEQHPECYRLLCRNCDQIVSGGPFGRPWEQPGGPYVWVPVSKVRADPLGQIRWTKLSRETRI